MIRFGDIVLVADLLDLQGRNPKDRPCVVVTPNEDIRPDGTIDVVAISSTLPQVLDEHHVLLPYHFNRHPKTGLMIRCAAICLWQDEVPMSRVMKRIGFVPGKQLLRISDNLQLLGKTLGKQADDPAISPSETKQHGDITSQSELVNFRVEHLGSIVQKLGDEGVGYLTSSPEAREVLDGMLLEMKKCIDGSPDLPRTFYLYMFVYATTQQYVKVGRTKEDLLKNIDGLSRKFTSSYSEYDAETLMAAIRRGLEDALNNKPATPILGEEGIHFGE